MIRIFACGAIVAAALTTGCAKNPDSIAALSLPAGTYSGRSCTQLRAELAKEENALAAASKEQRQAQTADTIGVILVGVPLGSVAGGERETEIASAKGRIQALKAQITAKSCS